MKICIPGKQVLQSYKLLYDCTDLKDKCWEEAEMSESRIVTFVRKIKGTAFHRH